MRLSTTSAWPIPRRIVVLRPRRSLRSPAPSGDTDDTAALAGASAYSVTETTVTDPTLPDKATTHRVVTYEHNKSPIIGLTPVENLFLNCGWGTGGFKATPGVGDVFAHTIARGKPHEYAEPFTLDRFTTGALVDEHGAAAVAH